MLGWSAATSQQPTAPAPGAGLLQLTGRILILEAMVGQHDQQLKDAEAAGRATAGRVDTLTGELNLYAGRPLGGYRRHSSQVRRHPGGDAAAVSIHRSSGCSLAECFAQDITSVKKAIEEVKQEVATVHADACSKFHEHADAYSKFHDEVEKTRGMFMAT